MIKKEHRLRKNKHFQFIYRKGLARQSRFLTIVYVRTRIQPFKVGFSVTKKVGKSVVRSRVKRLLTESFNVLQSKFNIHHNYVFIAKPGIENLTLQEIIKEMKVCLTKAELYNE